MKFSDWPISGERSYNDKDTIGMSKLLHRIHVEDVRPYYKCYPAILANLLKLNLDMKLADIRLKERVFAIRCSDDSRLVIGPARLYAICTAFVQFKECGAFLLETITKEVDGNDGTFNFGWYQDTIDSSLQDEDQRLNYAPESYDTSGLFQDEVKFQLSTMALKIALTVHMLAEDPSIITPEVMGKDKPELDSLLQKQHQLAMNGKELSDADKAKIETMVERAKRHGINGHNIGESYETCPHYRRPHFGIRHTGKGRTVPRIVPISGSVVHRSKLTDVPTGYIMPDGTEVEP